MGGGTTCVAAREPTPSTQSTQSPAPASSPTKPKGSAPTPTPTIKYATLAPMSAEGGTGSSIDFGTIIGFIVALIVIVVAGFLLRKWMVYHGVSLPDWTTQREEA